MLDLTVAHLADLFSEARLLAYANSGTTPQAILKSYHANIMLAEALTPTFHYIEVILRNRVDCVIRMYFGSDWLVKKPNALKLSHQDTKKIAALSQRIRNDKKKQPSHDDLLAQMTFGFWCSFFHRSYDPVLWHRKEALKIVFPFLQRKERSRKKLEQKIFKIKEMRNRISHCEPIFKDKAKIHEVYTLCHDLMKAMSPLVPQMISKIDRFPEIYQTMNARDFQE